MATRISPEEVENFIGLYRAGKNTPEIAQLTGRSLRAVCYSLREAGVELRAEQPNQTPPEMEDRVFALYQEGHIRAEIARITGLWDVTVGGILRRRLGHEPDWNDPERKAKRAKIWGNPENQPTLTPPETQDRILALYREETSWNRIADETGVSVKSVANILARRGAAVARAFKLNGEQRLEIMTMLAAGVNLHTISQVAGLGEDAVKKFTGHWRPSLFREIDTPEKAYWFGFLNADGTIVGVNPGNLALQCTLARKDRGHLVKLRDFLGIKREIWDYEARTIGNVLRPYSRLICQHRPVVMDLVRHGILPEQDRPRKTLGRRSRRPHAALLARHGRRRRVGTRQVLQRHAGGQLRRRERLSPLGGRSDRHACCPVPR